MRHGKKFNHLGRTASHRKAMLSNMASSLILHKRIQTTTAKAKELRKYIEPLITKAKEDTTHNRRVVFSYLQNKESVKVLFDEISGKVGSRPGGYTRILKLGNRLGDNADMAMIELVDFNELLLSEDKPAKGAKTRRSRRSSGKKADTAAAPAVEEAEVVEEVKAEAAEAATEEKADDAAEASDEETKKDAE